MDEQEQTFNKIKEILTTEPILHLPNRTGVFVLETDTSSRGIGGILKQIQNGEEWLIAYSSKTINDTVRRYSESSELELIGLLQNVKVFSSLLEGVHFYMLTDHRALIGLLQSRLQPSSHRLARLIERLGSYSFSVRYAKGENLKMADLLSWSV